eukprot:m51a1_g6922 hypothetical protein (88) ;mRNA; f:160947-161210
MQFPFFLREALAATGFGAGQLCPLGLAAGARVYLDASLLRFEHVYVACGAEGSRARLRPMELQRVAGGCLWVDVCRVQGKWSLLRRL